MLFNSIDFLLFFPAVVLIYFLLPRKVRYIWLLFASYYFYMCWNAKYAVLIGISTIATYISSLLIVKFRKRQTKRGEKLVVLGCLLINFGILFFFKYFDFALHNLNRILALVHVEAIGNPFSFLLPVGISFYTFQAVSYTLDVYRGEIEPERNFLKYALFVSFFPQLVAGPIERSKNLLGQIQTMELRRSLSYERLVKGFALMVWGLFMKMVIADRISLFVDGVFADLYACGTVETILAAVAFAIQIYCDFAGYSSVAIGAACILGFDLMDNFDAPYFAGSIQEFWRRWHISLSTWFRDYVYIPLGGSRCSKGKKYRNLMITFLVSGLWHGAAWNYVVWGGIHGIYQVVGDLAAPFREKCRRKMGVNTRVFSYRFGQVFLTFALTCFAWIFFRAESFSEALYFLNRMVTHFNPWVIFDESLYTFGLNHREMMILLAGILLLVLVDLLRYRKHISLGDFLLQQNLWFRYLVLVALVVIILVFGEYGMNFDSGQFIYFAF